MSKWIVLLAMFPLVLVLCVAQSENPQSPSTAPRPVKLLPSPTPSSGGIHFESFEFQQLFITNHPGSWAIKGEPTKGARFFVEAKLYGEEAISTAKFEAVDVRGNLIQKVLIERRADANGGSGFYGVMKVPDRPFRVVISGKGVDGLSYSRTYERLFRPTIRVLRPIVIPGAKATDATQKQKIETAALEFMNKMEEELSKKAGEMIVMPHMRVFNVMYAPYLSKTGRQLGLRITYDIEFSQDGYYNPELHMYPDYKNPDWRGRIDMNPLTGSIDPVPAEAGSPQLQPHILAYGAGYIYSRGTTYHFTAEYIPNYVIQNEQKTKFCIWYQQYKYSPELHAAWKAILDSAAPTKYSLSINNTNFGAEIEDLSQSALFKNFVAEGAKDCGEQPTSRF